MTPSDERRQFIRVPSDRSEGGVSGRIRPGHQVRILDLSPGGVLVETDRPLPPGAVVEWYVEMAGGRHATRALVVRCYVRAVGPDSLLFRGALEFERLVPWLACEPALAVRGPAR
jgi:PilZ domain-containing protein